MAASWRNTDPGGFGLLANICYVFLHGFLRTFPIFGAPVFLLTGF